MRKIVAALWLLLAACLICSAQNQMMNLNYIHGETTSFVDNSITCQSVNCLHLGNATFSTVYSGGEYAGALDSAGHPFFFSDYPTNHWTQNTAMGVVNSLAIQSNDNIYALKTVAHCGSSVLGIFKWSGTTWTEPSTSSCALPQSLSAGIVPGTLLVVAGDTYLYYSSNGGVTWTKVTAAGTGWKFASISSPSLAFAVKASGSPNIYVVNPQTGANNSTGGTTNYPLGVSAGGMAYAIGTDTFLWRYDGTTTSWTKFDSSGLTSIANGGTNNVWTVGPASAGHNVWRFPEQGLMLTSQLTGNTNCPSGCPQNAKHTPHGQVQFAGKHTGGAKITGPQVLPATYVNVSASDTIYDPYACYEGNPECFVSIEDGVDCTVAGNDYFWSDTGMPTLTEFIENCYSAFKNLLPDPPSGTGACYQHQYVTPSGVQKSWYCDYPVQNWCSNTTKPDYNVSVITDVLVFGPPGTPPASPIWGWHTPLTQLCFHLPWDYNADGTKAWKHFPSGIPGSSELGQDDMIPILNPGISPVPCTYNP